MKNQILILLFLFSFGANVLSQQSDAEVVTIVAFGEFDYAYILSEEDVLYKTSIFNHGTLEQNAVVQIESTITSGMVQVFAPEILTNLFAQRVVNSNNEVTIPLTNMPVLDNEILFFETEQKAFDYYISLNEYLEDPSWNDSIEEEFKLQTFEDMFENFVSYRKDEEDFYDWDNRDYTLTEINDFMENEVINDYVMKSLINRDRMIGIGDSVYFTLAEDFEIRIPKSDFSGIEILKGIENVNDFMKKRGILRDHEYVNDSKYIFTPWKAVFEDVNLNYRLETEYYLEKVSCSDFTKTLIIDALQYTRPNANSAWEYQSLYFDDHVNANAVVMINWGDGNIEWINSYNGQVVSHTYPAYGTYHVQVNIDFPSATTPNGNIADPPPLVEGGGQGTDLKFVVNSSSCSKIEDHEGSKTDQVISGSWMMTNKIWIKQSGLRNYYGSYTHAWKQRNNGNWRRKRSNIYTKITGTYRIYNCQLHETKTKNKLANNSKRVRKFVTEWMQGNPTFSNGDVYSHHALYPPGGGPGSALQNDLFINPCQ